MRRAPPRMDASEACGQIMIDAGDERQAGHRGEPGPDAPQGAEGDEEGGHRGEAGQAEAGGGGVDGVDDSLQTAHLLRRQRHQNAERSQSVDGGDEWQGREDAPRDGAPRVADLLPHERGRLQSGERERDGRPEDQVLHAETGHERDAREVGRRPKTRPGHEPDRQEGQQGGPAREGADVRDPLPELQAEQVRDRPERESQESRDDDVGPAAGQMTPAFPADVQGVQGGEVEHSGEIGEVAHPVGPAGHEGGEVAEGTLAPDVHASFLRVARRHLNDGEREGDRHGQKRQEPDGDRARAGDRRDRHPLQVDPCGDEVQHDVAEAHGAPQLGGVGRGIVRRHGHGSPRRLDGRRESMQGEPGAQARGPGESLYTARSSRGGRAIFPGTEPGRRTGHAPAALDRRSTQDLTYQPAGRFVPPPGRPEDR